MLSYVTVIYKKNKNVSLNIIFFIIIKIEKYLVTLISLYINKLMFSYLLIKQNKIIIVVYKKYFKKKLL